MNKCRRIKKAKVELLIYYSEKTDQDMDSKLSFIIENNMFSISVKY